MENAVSWVNIPVEIRGARVVNGMAYAVLIGAAPGVYCSKPDAETACRGVKYFLMKHCCSVSDASTEFASFQSRRSSGSVVAVYTDGACSNNGKAAACAGVGVFWGDDDPRNVSRPVHGAATNNVAELEAVEDALDAITAMVDGGHNDGDEFRILTDSLYVIQCVVTWFGAWRARGWKTASGSPVKNLDLIRRIREKLDRLEPAVTLVHVRGHAGVPGNEAADRLAVAGAKTCT